MKKFRKILLSALSLVLVVALTIVGTVAFLQDEDGEVNVMTVGNVHITQHEKQFAADGVSYEDFVQKKDLYPVPDEALDNEDFRSVIEIADLAPATNVVDKIVSVENWGKSEAFVRTVFAFEMGNLTEKDFENVFVYRVNDDVWNWEEIGVSNINGAKYYVVVAEHNGAVASKTTTAPSLLQVYLKSYAGNEECEAIDGNGNGTFDILTMSQAVQTVGFANATEALDKAFGDVTVAQNPWTDGAEYKVSTPEQLEVALSVGGTVTLTDDVELDEAITIPSGIIAVLDLNKNEFTGNIVVEDGGSLTVKEGTVDNADDSVSAIQVNDGAKLVLENVEIESARHGVRVEGGEVVINGGIYKVDPTSTKTLHALNVSDGGKVTINGGTFIGPKGTMADSGSAVNVQSGSTVIINGGDFKGGKNKTLSSKGTLTVNGGTFDQDPSAFAGENVVVKTDGTWTVYPINDTWDGSTDTTWYDGVQRTASADNQYYIYTAEQLAGLAKLVNEYGVSFANSTITLMVNVDLQNKDWTPIGNTSKYFDGSFDGNNKTVSNLSVNVVDHAGLFGNVRGSLKNIIVKNATLTATNYAGAVVGRGYAKVEKCHAENVTIVCVPVLEGGVYDDGAKAGGIIGQILEGGNMYVADCSVKNINIKAYRDLGGVVGMVHNNNKLYGCSAENVTLEYVTVDKPYADNTPNENMGYVAGRVQSSATVENVTYNGLVCVSTAKQLADAVAAGYTNIWLDVGEYNVYGCGGKNLTINGSKNAVIKLYNEGEDGCDYGFGGNGTGVGHVTFNGITIDTTANTGNYKGFAYMKGTFNDCNFVGAYSLNNANDFVFNRCTFDFKNGYFWTWGANSVTFNGCVFNGNSKAILAHGYASTVINVNNCTFAATEKGYTGAGDNTAAIEIDPAGNNTYTINFTGKNTITDSYAGLTRVKDGSTGHEFVEPTVVEDATELEDALKNGENIELESNLTINSNQTSSNSGYGATGVTVKNGDVFDGQGNTFTVNGANGTWDCAINPQNGTVQNVIIAGAFRGIFMGGATGDVYIDNVIVKDSVYTFNSDGGNKNYGVYISNSTLNGWTSYSNVHKEVVFTNCNFGEGSGYAFCRPYNASVFENCVFEEGFEFDTSKTSDIVFINCYYGDTLITADNADSLGMFYNGLNGITIR